VNVPGYRPAMTPAKVVLSLDVPGGALAGAAAAARAVEDAGLDGVFAAELTSDPLLSLTVAAGATSRIDLGTNIVVAFARSPMTLAVQARAVQDYSQGRLVLGRDAVLGLLDDYGTRSGYVITPVVCWAGPVGELTAAEAEVAEIHHIPIDALDVPPRFVAIPESDAPVIQLPLLGGYVHAPTAAVVYQFCQVTCRGLHTRVAHLEQPVFAWR